MRLLAPAKINLHLRVGPRRDDGFHPLLTWMCTVGLFDTLTIERANAPSAATTPASWRSSSTTPGDTPARGHDASTAAAAAEGSSAAASSASAGVTLITDDARLPGGAENLVTRVASALLADTLGRRGETAADPAARRGADAPS